MSLHSCGQRVSSVTCPRTFHGFCSCRTLWTTASYVGPSILPRGRQIAGFFSSFRTREADLSAERAQAEAEARLPRAHVDPRRAVDPEAPPRQGAQAPVGVVQRRNRLSRSRDFDAVYRHGRSASTRFLTLYWFRREEEPGDPRLGLAVPKAAGNSVVRNRTKRQLREIWRHKLERGEISSASDYVLVVRPGLPEAAEARGHEWLVERVDEVLGKVAA